MRTRIKQQRRAPRTKQRASRRISLTPVAPPQPAPRKRKVEEAPQVVRTLYIVTGDGPTGNIRRVYPTKAEAERDADRCRGRKGYRNIAVVPSA